MSKERLEEIAYNVGISLDGEKALMSSDDYDFLYNYALQQAERVQELERKLDRVRFVNDIFLEKEKKQNKRYREALEFVDEELELVLHSNKSLVEKMFYIENSKRKITEALEESE